MKIRTVLACPACPATFNVDQWYAIDDDTYDGIGHVGWGDTEAEALADLKEQIGEQIGDYCKFCGRKIIWADYTEIDEETERICFDCDRQRDDARRDEALGI